MVDNNGVLLTQTPEGKQVKRPVIEAEEHFQNCSTKWLLNER